MNRRCLRGVSVMFNAGDISFAAGDFLVALVGSFHHKLFGVRRGIGQFVDIGVDFLA